MTVYSLYIYDRQCSCVFYHAFPGHTPPPRLGHSTLPNVFPAHTAGASSSSGVHGVNGSTTRTSMDGRGTTTASGSASGSGAESVRPPWERGVPTRPNEDDTNADGDSTAAAAKATRLAASAALPFDEEAKLVYGIVFSLRNLVNKLSPSGRDASDSFHSYSTSHYKLHYFHTPSNYHFVLVSSPRQDSLRPQLRALYQGAFWEWVIRNPMVELDSTKGTGIDNVAFRSAVERTLESV
ncbi:BQ5605_C010g06077 [Microbotryum silenes-dioicae]|uniref:Trafficking protein particle complex subunit n=1 Tax=Microbotryum silenes-dioicae TaxID=796604 RepID=A0A2X0LV07_9BASI|nr:BQ5605_C010g06077 [Microbotryum silenes-dioicae]